MEKKGEIVLYQPDENIRLEVRFEQETVWLNRYQMRMGRGLCTVIGGGVKIKE